MNWVKYLGAALLSLLAVGCTDYNQLKVDLQDEYDRLNPDGDRAVCYFVGDVQFPYNEEPVLDTELQYYQWNKNRLTRNLPLFTELGLLSREQVSNEPLLYRYQLTDLGKQYQYTIKRLAPVSRVYMYENHFCYGKRVLLKVTDVSDQTLNRASGKYIETTVKYGFKLENIPDWQKSEKLEQIYSQSYGYSLEKVYRGSATMKKENGQYYNDGGVYNSYLR